MALKRMLEKLVISDAVFKNQQRGEPDLSNEEKYKIGKELYEEKPQVFLSKFKKFLTEEDIICFHSLEHDYFIRCHINDIRKSCENKLNKKLIKNRRYEAMKKLITGNEYFSEEDMKRRDPLLYEEMIGQHLSEQEIKDQAAKLDNTLSGFLLRHEQATENNIVYELQKENQENQMEEGESEDESEESEIEDEDCNACKISPAEKQMLREEFIKIMHHRFLDGEDKDFNYKEVDENDEYDSLEQRERDEQEKYFDEDDDCAIRTSGADTNSATFLSREDFKKQCHMKGAEGK